MNLNTKLTGTTVVSLSRRNLEGLLSQLDSVGAGDAAQLMRQTEDGLLIVVAEEDSVHYHSPAREESLRGVAGQSAPDQPFREWVES